MEAIENFHLLRPWALLLIPVVVTLLYLAAKQAKGRSAWNKWVDEKLLASLLVDQQAIQRQTPWWLLAIVLCFGILGLAGPSWEKIPQPIIQKQDALVVVLDLSPSMNSQDIKPSRLSISRFKLIDLMKLRKEGQTGLIVYGGEAHIVTPLTDDVETIINLLPVLKPSLMPIPGSNTESAIERAIQLLKDSGRQYGDILLLSDGVDPVASEAINDVLQGSPFRLSVMAVGSQDGGPIPSGRGFIKDNQGNIVIAKTDIKELKDLANDNGGRFVQLSPGEQDLQSLEAFWQNRSDLSLGTQDQQDNLVDREFDQWQDNGHWLALVLLAFFPFAFRKGGLISTFAMLALFSSLLSLPSVPAMADGEQVSSTSESHNEKQDSLIDKLWYSKDQRALKAYQDQDYNKASELFKNPQWQALSDYQGGQYDKAAESLANLSKDSLDPELHYNHGNALAKAGQLDEAIKAYDRALELQSNFEDAQFNKDLIEKLKQENQQENNQNQQNQESEQQDSGEQESDSKEDQQGSDNKENSEEQQQPDNSNEQSSEHENSDQENRENESEEEKNNKEQEAQNKQNDKPETEEPKTEEQETEEQQAQAMASPEESLSDEEKQALEQWLKQVPDDPSGLLREKFLYEERQKQLAIRNGKLKLPKNDAHKRY
ncbi:VWA domain-containing protein [uncultured Pseudoteredinibacter sp.]|uniref:VWA domain-containing protein n=1 Tax=uncultured Pseudoteredinibacter sp. TaxID=1641701 RepID=UPI002625D441|nr:VWA domain-containing protein [uncultured Pseudoteredinibacter sp.]